MCHDHKLPGGGSERGHLGAGQRDPLEPRVEVDLHGESALGTAATTRLLNPILIFKLVVIVVAAPLMFRMQKKIFDNPSISEDVLPPGAREMAASQLFLWLIVVIAGRLIAYSATILGEGY